MTLPVRERILAAVATALDGLTTSAGESVTVYRNRRKPIPETARPVIVITDGSQEADEETAPQLTLYRLTLTIEGEVGAASEAKLGPAVNDLYALALSALAADRTFGGLAVDWIEGELQVDLDRGEGKAPAAAFGLLITIEYFTKPGDPYTVGP